MSVFEYMLQPLKKFADFSGRASRAEFWFFMLFVAILLSISRMFDGPFVFGRFSALVGLALLCPQIAVLVRRLHDVGRSGKEAIFPIVLLVAAPFVNMMGGFVMKMVKLGYVGITLLAFTGLVLLLIKKGSSVPNKYGAAPEAFSFAK